MTTLKFVEEIQLPCRTPLSADMYTELPLEQIYDTGNLMVICAKLVYS